MPITKRAIKKMRHDRKLTINRASIKVGLKKQIKLTRKSPTKANIRNSYQLLDKAVKKHIIHKNKSSRIKSRLSNLKP